MIAKRIYFIMLGGLCLVVLVAIVGLVLGNMMLRKQADKLVDSKLQARVLDERQVILTRAQRDVVKYMPLNEIAQKIVPQDKDQAITVREIVTLAEKTGVKLGGITFPASTLGQRIASGSGTGTGGTTTPATGGASSKISQVTPVKGITGVYELPITVQSDAKAQVSFEQLVAFLRLLENNRHTAHVSQLTIHPTNATGTKLSFELIITVYIKP